MLGYSNQQKKTFFYFDASDTDRTDTDVEDSK